MAGCETKGDGAGDHDAGEKQVLKWVFGGAGLLGLAAFLEAAGISGVTAGAGAVIVLAVLIAAFGGAIIGFAIGFAVDWFTRLYVQDPSTITMSGCILCAGKNSGIPPFNDNDWTFNFGGSMLALLNPIMAGLTVDTIRTRPAPGDGPTFPLNDHTTGQPYLHCEISSHIGDYAAVGTAVGSVAGAIGGAIAAAAICVALGLATFGIGAALCLLVVALGIAVGAFAGGAVGDAIGGFAGWIADGLSDFDKRGEAITRGCIMIFTGRWVTDSNHQHNEIHDIASAQLVECNDCFNDRGGRSSSGLIAAVGIGRHPTGRDP